MLAAWWLHLPFSINDWLFSFCRNDSFWYDGIARVGYPASAPQGYEQSAYAFFPLYPLLVRPFYLLTHNFSSAAFLLGIFTTLGWISLQFRYLRTMDFKPKSIFLFTLFYQAFPFHYFFHVYYSEQLFCLLLLFILWSLHLRNKAMLFAGCFLLALCRPTGIVFSVALFFYPFTPFWQQKEYLHWKKWLNWWPLSGAFLGLLLFNIYSYCQCGDFWANKHAMIAWSRIFCWPWESFMVKETFEYKVMALLTIGLLLLAAIASLKTPIGFKLYALITLVFPLTTGNTDSYYRYFAVNFPIFEQLYHKVCQYKLLLYGIMVLCFAINIATYRYWVLVHGQLAY